MLGYARTYSRVGARTRRLEPRRCDHLAPVGTMSGRDIVLAGPACRSLPLTAKNSLIQECRESELSYNIIKDNHESSTFLFYSICKAKKHFDTHQEIDILF